MLQKEISAKAPPVKIQGIKTKLVPYIARHIKWDGKGKWIEPFTGSGAVAFNIQPNKALLADTNVHLINLYSAIQSKRLTAGSLQDYLVKEGEKLRTIGEKHYYDIRKRFNDEGSPYDFIFLNRSCFNGVVRFNSKGKFNVPFCRKPDRFRPALVTKICNQVAWLGKVLHGKDWDFVCQPWEKTLAASEPSDFVYLDPPYVGRHTDYYNQWDEAAADNLAIKVRQLKCGFAYSMWRKNQYRENTHLDQHFADCKFIDIEHFYHVGSSEELRNAMVETLIISDENFIPDLGEDKKSSGDLQIALL